MTISSAGRSRIMKAIKSKNTKPEMAVRRLVHSLGYRYRLHRSGLPGTPDLVFGPKAKVIFVHGCFWHAHSAAGCSDGHRPKANADFWMRKLDRNVLRDAANVSSLRKSGWRVLTIWECEIANEAKLTSRLKRFLG